MVLIKTFNALAEPVVLEVQPQHVSRVEFVREQGEPKFVRHAGKWLAFTPNGAVPVDKMQAAALEDMKMDFAQATGWGFQIKEKIYSIEQISNDLQIDAAKRFGMDAKRVKTGPRVRAARW